MGLVILLSGNRSLHSITLTLVEETYIQKTLAST